MFHTYGDFAEVVRSEGIRNVLTDIEQQFPDLYSVLIQGVMEKAKINKDKTCALLRKEE